jgi:hypothetical protein
MLLIPFAIRLRSDGDEGSRFLAVGAASMLICSGGLEGGNGVFDDWNLYAIGGLFIALCVWRYAAAVASNEMDATRGSPPGRGWLPQYLHVDHGEPRGGALTGGRSRRSEQTQKPKAMGCPTS